MDIYSIANGITVCFESFYLFLLFEAFLDRREHLSKYVYYAVVVGMAVLIYISNMIAVVSVVNVIFMMTIGFVASLFYKGKMSIHILAPVVGIMISAFAEIITLFALSFFLNMDVTLIETGYIGLIGMLISKIFGYIVIKYITYRMSKKFKYTSTNNWMLYFFVFFSVTLTMCAFCKALEEGTSEYTRHLIIICACGISVTTVIILYLYERNLQQNDTLAQNSLAQTELENQIKHYNDLMMSQEQVRSIKHDLKNHMLSIKAYIDSNEYEQATEYIKSLLNSIDGQDICFDTGNTVLDAILSVKKCEAERVGIQFISNLRIPKMLPIDDSDICIIFGNLLDNAIEACKKVSNSPYISVTMIYGEKMLLCKIKNSFSPKTFLGGYTSKADIHNHGIGTMNVKQALQKYAAVFNSETTESEFTVSIAFANIEPEK